MEQLKAMDMNKYKNYSYLKGSLPRTPRMHKYWPWLEQQRSSWLTTRNNQRSQTRKPGIQAHPPRQSQTTSMIFHNGRNPPPSRARNRKPLTERNNGGAQNTAPKKSNGYGTIQKITEIRPTPHQSREEASSQEEHTTRK